MEIRVILALSFLCTVAASVPSIDELNELYKQEHVRNKRSDCVDQMDYCSSYKPYCNDPAYKDYLMKECKKTCGFCTKPCLDRYPKCTVYLSSCAIDSYRKSLEYYCSKTCGFCQVPTTTQPPTTLPRTEKPIDHGNIKCGTKGKGNTRIVGGTRAKKGAWPWQISMNYKNNKAAKTPHWCGGSVVARQWIVTAAHCFVYGDNPDDYTVVMGEHDLNVTDGYEQKIGIERIIKHPFYDAYNNHDYDVALIKLKSNLIFNDRVRPVCLPSNDYPAGTNCYISGWGHLFESGHGPWVLHQAMVPLVSRSVCQKSYDDLRYKLTARMRCAGNGIGGIDACQGDSGGPLVCRTGDTWYLMGAISWGIGCARKNRYGVYADMMDLKYWVQGTIHVN
ncbi:prostasin-like [Actinia tenebrosa]|uniref:Prostasin-like n=1 Tax=Actinia tenebrosa TaxID=6105 RepID=A0A6P8I3B1_ACTTE|nr:prostasin-like [Actinia tenebrosa]XP_031563034.1 prostasin-like [Actinia tenebrosa]